MKRRTALVMSVVGALLVAGMLVMAAALVQMNSQRTGIGSAAPAGPTLNTATASTEPLDRVIEYQDVYEAAPGAGDVNRGTSGPTGTPAGSGSTATASDPMAPPAPPASGPVTSSPSQTTTTTAKPTPTTTASTLPPGVPADWPPGKPIPPMPAGCQKPQLEDNGVWNCDH